MSREYFCAFHSYLKSIEPLNDSERGRLFTALLEYSMTGITPEFRGNERFIFPTIKEQIDRDVKKYNDFITRQKEKGMLGGRPKTQTNLNNPNNPVVILETQKSLREDKDKDKDKDKDEIANAIEAALPPSAPARAKAQLKLDSKKTSYPTVDEISDYCRERNNNIDPESFWAWYEARGWCDNNGRKISSWKAAIITWEKRERNNPNLSYQKQVTHGEKLRPDGLRENSFAAIAADLGSWGNGVTK